MMKIKKKEKTTRLEDALKEVSKEETKRLNVSLELDMHAKFKSYCAIKETTMVKEINQFIANIDKENIKKFQDCGNHYRKLQKPIKNFNVMVPKSVHNKLSILCAENYLKISAVIVTHIERCIRND